MIYAITTLILLTIALFASLMYRSIKAIGIHMQPIFKWKYTHHKGIIREEHIATYKPHVLKTDKYIINRDNSRYGSERMPPYEYQIGRMKHSVASNFISQIEKEGIIEERTLTNENTPQLPPWIEEHYFQLTVMVRNDVPKEKIREQRISAYNTGFPK